VNASLKRLIHEQRESIRFFGYGQFHMFDSHNTTTRRAGRRGIALNNECDKDDAESVY
jgi:hypothetical protein